VQLLQSKPPILGAYLEGLTYSSRQSTHITKHLLFQYHNLVLIS
jgi:hypothetical protein